ncbi:MAG: hypothetical protein LBD06_10670 [Candidatus Accumulibacter sp.]|nr:hypothetical protein [Accumulibacter sp.]
MLNKSNISPKEVAALDVRLIERAPGIGRKGIELIDNWLRSHGYQLSGPPCQQINRLQFQQRKQRRIEEAIELLRVCGYEVQKTGVQRTGT